jgi:hypothetical protein
VSHVLHGDGAFAVVDLADDAIPAGSESICAFGAGELHGRSRARLVAQRVDALKAALALP